MEDISGKDLLLLLVNLTAIINVFNKSREGRWKFQSSKFHSFLVQKKDFIKRLILLPPPNCLLHVYRHNQIQIRK